MSEPYISQIIMFAGNFAIRAYAMCDGQLIAISQNEALFSLIGTTYGGDGRTTFGVPDLRGRVPISYGQSSGTSYYPEGARFGTERVTLTSVNLPSHGHGALASTNQGAMATPINNVAARGMAGTTEVSQYTDQSPSGSMASGALSQTGGNQSHDNMMPSLAINFQIALFGLYPTRN
jgi:microcystin-dependent protein